MLRAVRLGCWPFFAALAGCQVADVEPRRLHDPSFDEYVAGLRADGVLSAQNAEDILTARRALWRNAATIPAEYEGFVGATVTGQLVYAASVGDVLAALNKANAPGRLGYFQYCSPADGAVPARERQR